MFSINSILVYAIALSVAIIGANLTTFPVVAQANSTSEINGTELGNNTNQSSLIGPRGDPCLDDPTAICPGPQKPEP